MHGGAGKKKLRFLYPISVDKKAWLGLVKLRQLVRLAKTPVLHVQMCVSIL